MKTPNRRNSREKGTTHFFDIFVILSVSSKFRHEDETEKVDFDYCD